MQNLDDLFGYYLQRDVVFSIDSKIIRDGKLILFSQKDYHLNFYFKNNNGDNKVFEIPYPFQIDKCDNHLVLRYDIETLSKEDDELYYRLLALNKKNNSKFYNIKMLMFEKSSLNLKPVEENS